MILIVAATQPELSGAADIPGTETLACGVGPVDAAARVAARLAGAAASGGGNSKVEALLHVGIAGARRAAAIEAGQLVIGSASVYCDTTSSHIEHRLMPDATLLGRLEHAFPVARLHEIGTSAEVGGSRHLDIEAMEGFAVLRAAELAGVPAVEVRFISNEVEEPDRSRWRFDLALDNLAASLPDLVAALVG